MIRDLYLAYIKNALNATIKRQCNFKLSKILNRQLCKGDVQMVNKDMQRCPINIYQGDAN